MVRVRDLRVPLSSRKLPHSPSTHPFAPQRMTPAQHRVIVDLIDATRPHRVIVDLKSRRRSRPAADSPSRQPRRRTARPRSPRHASRRGRTETSRTRAHHHLAPSLPPRCADTLQLNARRLGSLPPPCRAGVGRHARRGDCPRPSSLFTVTGSVRRPNPPSSYSSTCFMRGCHRAALHEARRR